MVEARLKYVKRVVDRYGKVRHYFRVGRDYFPISGPPASPTFIRDYYRLLALHHSQRLVTKRPRATSIERRLKPGTVRWLIIKYVASAEFGKLAVSTRSTYSRALTSLAVTFGERALASIETTDIDLYHSRLAQERGPASADLQLRLLSILWKFSKCFADQFAVTRQNPTLGIATAYRVHKPHRPWPVPVQKRFLSAASESTKLAFYLLLFTGQRRTDVTNMRWSDYNGERFQIVQSKTGEAVSVSAHSILKRVLAAAPRRSEYILTDERGRPFAPDNLTRRIKRALRTIGAAEYKLHGLRKTAAVALAEAGGSELEIMAVLGHRTSTMAQYYCREANRSRLAERAIRAWERAEW
jgi:integrase